MLTHKSTRRAGVLKRRRRSAADNCWGLVDQLVVLEGLYHEQGEVHAARDVAFEDRVAHVPTPHRQTLAFALFEIAPADDGPPRFAFKHSPARFHLIVDVYDARQTR
jgi:hypothetical protein